jgi:hypothetical protein
LSTWTHRNFSGGELDPALHSRVDNVKYATGLKTLRNAMIQRSSGSVNRPGTELVGRVYRSTTTLGDYSIHRLVPYFVPDFSVASEYVIEIGEGYLRPLKNGAQILESAYTITAITQASPGVVTYAAGSPADPPSFANGDEIRIVDCSIAELNNRNFKVAAVDTVGNTFALQDLDGNNFDTTGLIPGVFAASFRRIYTILNANYLSGALAALQYSQNGSELLLRRSLGIDRLVRVTDTNWTLTSGVSFAPAIAAPASISPLVGAGYTYAAAAVDRDSGEESIAVTAAGANAGAGFIDCAAVTNAAFYRFYVRRAASGEGWGLLAVSASPRYLVGNVATDTLDYSRRPMLAAEVPWVATGFGVPSAIRHAQQRLFLARTTAKPLRVYGSHLGSIYNFTRQYPIADDGTFSFELPGNHGDIRHILDLEKLVLLTSKGEFVCHGNEAGFITPTEINAKQLSYNGSALLSPVLIDSNAIYLQEGGSVVRDLGMLAESTGYRGNDLTVFSAHLFRGHTISDWAYQKLPNSILWAVRSDGALLGLTYVKEHAIWGWHRHDTDGEFKQACCAQEGTEYAVYFKVDREINGQTVSFIERMSTRILSDPYEMNFMDCSLAYDGRNTDTNRLMSLSGGTGTWNEQDLSLRSSASFFQASDVGNVIYFVVDGLRHGFTITAYSSTTAVTVQSLDGDVPDVLKSVTSAISSITESLECKVTFTTAHGLADGQRIYLSGVVGMALPDGFYIAEYDDELSILLKSTAGAHVDSSAMGAYGGGGTIERASSAWERAVDEVSGLWHLEGKDVSVLGDGTVVASPNNPDLETITVTDGIITLPQCYAFIRVGLPYISDMETLDIDLADGETLSDKKSLISQVTLQLHETRGVFAGVSVPSGNDPIQGLYELKLRDQEGYHEVTNLFTGKTSEVLQGDWETNGRIALRQIDPLPMGVMAIMPAGLIPAGRKG